MRLQPAVLAVATLLAVAACVPEVSLDVDLRQANLRVPRQTAADTVLVYPGDVDQPYDVLADLEVIVRQQGAFGDPPTRELATRVLQRRAGKLGAHALLYVEFGQQGSSWWSYNELRGHGRAIRFR